MRTLRSYGLGQIVKRAFPMLAGVQYYVIRMRDGSFVSSPTDKTTQNPEFAAIFDSFELPKAEQLARQFGGKVVPGNKAETIVFYETVSYDRHPRLSVRVTANLAGDIISVIDCSQERFERNSGVPKNETESEIVGKISREEINRLSAAAFRREPKAIRTKQLERKKKDLEGGWRSPKYRQEPRQETEA